MEDKTTLFAVLGWICAGLSFFFVPVIFGPAGIVLGYFVFKEQKGHGIAMMVVSIFGTMIGMFLGLLFVLLTI